MRHRRSPGWIFQRKDSDNWYIGYFADGKKIREKVGPLKKEAAALLTQRMGELDGGKWTHPARPLTLDDLLALVQADYRAQGKRSWDRVETSAKHLRAVFGRADAREITAARLARYANDRIDSGAAVSTARNELNALKRGMSLAVRQGLLPARPMFPTLVPKNVRLGFFERSDLDAVLAQLPEVVRPLVTFMFWTGWRSGEVRTRQWRHVDESTGVIRLESNETKNDKGRDFPYELVPELAALIAGQRRYTDAVEKRTGQIVRWVFHREGKPVRSFRTAWRAACDRAAHGGKGKRDKLRELVRPELLGRIPHDFRRTAVRNLVRAGVSEKVAMELTGHLTRSVFERYNITTDRDRRDAVAKLAAAAPNRQVVALPDPNRTRRAVAQ